MNTVNGTDFVTEWILDLEAIRCINLFSFGVSPCCPHGASKRTSARFLGSRIFS